MSTSEPVTETQTGQTSTRPSSTPPSASRGGSRHVQRMRSLAGQGYEVQRRAVQAQADDAPAVQEAAADGVASGGGALPFGDKMQAAFGRHDLSQARAHTGPRAAHASEAMGADAYASGSDIAFGGEPDLHTAAHEAAHVVQQRGGVSLSGGVGQAGDPYEQHADRVADAVVQGQSAEPILDEMAGVGPVGASASGAPGRAVQRRAGGGQSKKPKDKLSFDVSEDKKAKLEQGDQSIEVSKDSVDVNGNSVKADGKQFAIGKELIGDDEKKLRFPTGVPGLQADFSIKASLVVTGAVKTNGEGGGSLSAKLAVTGRGGLFGGNEWILGVAGGVELEFSTSATVEIDAMGNFSFALHESVLTGAAYLTATTLNWIEFPWKSESAELLVMKGMSYKHGRLSWGSIDWGKDAKAFYNRLMSLKGQAEAYIRDKVFEWTGMGRSPSLEREQSEKQRANDARIARSESEGWAQINPHLVALHQAGDYCPPEYLEKITAAARRAIQHQDDQEFPVKLNEPIGCAENLVRSIEVYKGWWQSHYTETWQPFEPPTARRGLFDQAVARHRTAWSRKRTYIALMGLDPKGAPHILPPDEGEIASLEARDVAAWKGQRESRERNAQQVKTSAHAPRR